MDIPLVDLKKQYFEVKNEIDRAIYRVINNSDFIGGTEVDGFEKEFAEYLDIPHCVSCGNGTDALEIILESMGIGIGCEVLVPALTWISTAEAVTRVGAKPVFVDILEDNYTLDPDDMERRITEKTKAVIPVHLYGMPCEMDKILHISKNHQLMVIEDCAQSHGAKYKGILTGCFGHAAAYSFYPGKNLGAYGDAGAIVTRDNVLAAKARMIANHGQLTKHHHIIIGRNSRMDGIQAAILRAKLPFLGRWIGFRRDLAKWYGEIIKKEINPVYSVPDYVDHAYHLFVIKSKNRKASIDRLASVNIHTAIHYPCPLPYLDVYKNKQGIRGPEYPVSLSLSKSILSLPMNDQLRSNIFNDDQIEVLRSLE